MVEAPLPLVTGENIPAQEDPLRRPLLTEQQHQIVGHLDLAFQLDELGEIEAKQRRFHQSATQPDRTLAVASQNEEKDNQEKGDEHPEKRGCRAERSPPPLRSVADPNQYHQDDREQQKYEHTVGQ